MDGVCGFLLGMGKKRLQGQGQHQVHTPESYNRSQSLGDGRRAESTGHEDQVEKRSSYSSMKMMVKNEIRGTDVAEKISYTAMESTLRRIRSKCYPNQPKSAAEAISALETSEENSYRR